MEFSATGNLLNGFPWKNYGQQKKNIFEHLDDTFLYTPIFEEKTKSRYSCCKQR